MGGEWRPGCADPDRQRRDREDGRGRGLLRCRREELPLAADEVELAPSRFLVKDLSDFGSLDKRAADPRTRLGDRHRQRRCDVARRGERRDAARNA